MKTIQFKVALFGIMMTLMLSGCTKDSDVEVPTAKTTIFAENFDGLAKINFSHIYQASGNSYTFTSQNFTNISDLTATNVSFQSVNPADETFKKSTANATSTAAINGILTYTDNAGNPFSIKGCITGQVNTGTTTKGFNFIPTTPSSTSGDYNNPSGDAYLLSLVDDSSFTAGSTVTTSNNQIDNVIDAYLLKSSGWFIANQTGTLQWIRDAYKGDAYAKMSSYYGGSGSPAVSWLISPAINLDTQDGERLFFQTAQDGYVRNSGNSLELFISRDYDPADFASASWERIDFNVANPNSTKYVYQDSGILDLSKYTGTIHLAFRYIGSAAASGGYQIDNLRIFY